MTAIADIIRDMWPAVGANMRTGSSTILICCPFHDERTPSCAVSVDKPVFFCHGCKTSGHLSQLFRQLGVGGSTAKLLIDRAGLSPQARQHDSTQPIPGVALNPYRGLHILSEDVIDAYRSAPLSLLNKGFLKQTLWHFEVGYDPMNVRVTFPLRNIYGDLVGVSGRALLDDAPTRYKIYKDELVVRARQEGWYISKNYSVEHVKKAILWHGHLTRPFFRTSENDWLVLTEGFKACMWVFQAGYQLVNGLVGSYLSGLQANLITREIGRVVLFLDNNEAGWVGTYHAAAALEKRGVDVRIATYPDDREQPDDLSDNEVLEAIADSTSFYTWRHQ